jgi:nitrite reductase/ring-hydroxylating ferredoxin subunit
MDAGGDDAPVEIACASIPEGGARVVPVGEDLEVAVFRVAGAFYAIDNRCPHKGGPLARGSLDGAVVTCPWHAFTVDVRTGRCPRNPGLRVRTFAVERVDDRLRIAMRPA